jgi:hypothetical protein
VTIPLGIELLEEIIATRDKAEAELEAFHNLRQAYEDDLKAAYEEVAGLHSQMRATDRQLDESGISFWLGLVVAVVGGGLFWGIVVIIVMW